MNSDDELDTILAEMASEEIRYDYAKYAEIVDDDDETTRMTGDEFREFIATQDSVGKMVTICFDMNLLKNHIIFAMTEIYEDAGLKFPIL